MASSNNANGTETDTYKLPRGQDESQRLEGQHAVFTKAQGYLIHPTISKTLTSDSAIADVAAGTGVWLLDVAKTHDFGSTASLHAFDISDAQYPPLERRPPNTHFHVADLKKPFPAEFHGRFDLVHLRLLAVALEGGEWLPAVQNLMTLLKPGVGYLQWCEGNFMYAGTPFRSELHSTTDYLRRGVERIFELGWNEDISNSIKQLEPAVRQSGLSDVKRDDVSTDRLPELREIYTRLVLAIVRTVTGQHTLRNTAGAWSEADNEKLLEGMEADLRSGGYCIVNIAVMIGRRP